MLNAGQGQQAGWAPTTSSSNVGHRTAPPHGTLLEDEATSAVTSDGIVEVFDAVWEAAPLFAR